MRKAFTLCVLLLGAMALISAAQDDSTVILKRPHLQRSHLSDIKVFGDRIFVNSVSPTPRLVIHNRLGQEIGAIALDAKLAGIPNDFLVAPDGTVVFGYANSTSGGELQLYRPGGSEPETVPLSEPFSIRHVAPGPAGEVYLLGIGQELGRNFRNIIEERPIEGPSLVPALYRVSMSGEVIDRLAPIPVPTSKLEMQLLRYYLDTTPFSVDPSGRKYFQIKKGQLVQVSSSGQVHHFDLPKTDSDVQLLRHLVPADGGILVELVEGQNQASEEELKRRPISVIMKNPVNRTYLFDPLTGLFSEVRSGRKRGVIAGRLSDGTLIEATFGGGNITVRTTSREVYAPRTLRK